MKMNFNTLLIAATIGLVVFCEFCNRPIDPRIEQFETEIAEHELQIDRLNDSISVKNSTIDSLMDVKNKKDTVYFTILASLPSFSMSGQYNILSQHLNASCGLKIANQLFLSDGDTLAALNNPELLCINTAFIERDMYSDRWRLTEQILDETNEIVAFQDSIIFEKDTIIAYKDSIIDEHAIVVDELNGKLTRQKWFTRGAIGTAIGILIFK